jgi:predicted O-methyltransferase YrrM
VPSLASARRSFKRAVRAASNPRDVAYRRRLRRRFEDEFLGERGALDRYEREIRDSGIVDHMREKRREYDALIAAAGGEGYTTGAIGLAERVYLYAIVRHLRPSTAVETGVANGFSTAFTLLALERNGEGHLHSIDLPRIVGEDDQVAFYEGEGRAGVPPEHLPGWLVPDHLRDRWTLRLGRSQDELPPLLEVVGELDFFMHDSEHSYECMSFEFASAWPKLRQGGVLVSDDVNSTAAFPELTARVRGAPIAIARGMALLVK